MLLMPKISHGKQLAFSCTTINKTAETLACKKTATFIQNKRTVEVKSHNTRELSQTMTISIHFSPPLAKVSLKSQKSFN